MNEPCFVLDWHAEQSIGRHATLPRHIILTLGQPAFALTPKCCLLSREAANTNFNVFGLTWPGIEPKTF